MPVASRIAATLTRHGQEITLRLAASTSQPVTWLDYPVMAHVIGARDSALAPGAGVPQMERWIRIAQAEIDAREVPRAVRQGDRIIIGGVTTTVQAPAEVRYSGGVPALHVIRVKGA